MVFGTFITSPRGSLTPVQSLRLAKAYLECASKEQDMDVTLVLCHDTEVSLSQAKRSAKNTDHQTLRSEIANAYADLGHLLHNRGRPSEAKASYSRAEKLGVTVKNPSQPAQHSRPNSIISALSVVNTAVLVPSVSPTTVTQQIQRRDIATAPTNIIFENVRPPSLEFKLPEPDEHLINTPQLAGCLGILQATRSPGDILDPDVRKWLQSIEKDEDEQDRLKVMATDIIRAFKRDELKDAKAVAEVVYLAPVLDKDAFRDLLNTFYVGIGQSGLLDFHQLDGIAYLIQGADNGHLEADDLVKILGLLRTRLTETHRQSPEHVYRLTITVSHVLDAMADTKVKDVDRVDLHEPLSAYLSGLQGSSDPYMVYQAAYACQALLCIPDDETPWQAAMRRTGKVVRGVSGLVSAVKGLDLNKLIDGLGDIQQGLAGASEIVGIVKTAYEGVASLAEGGQTFMKCLKEGLSFDRKRAWYSVLRGADALIRDGELSTFKELVCEAPCRRDLAFQWGICQRLGEIASNPMWGADSRQSAIAFLGEMYRNDIVWGQHAPVKQLVINILMQLGSASGSGLQLHVTTAVALLGELEVDQDVSKRALFLACRSKEPTTHPLRVALSELGTPSLIDRVQKRPDVEGQIRVLRKHRVKEEDNSVYIPPQAKTSLQASDDSGFPLMEKMNEFLGSNRQVFLLLGDSGTGKSTFNRQLEIELWQSYKKGGRIPLHVNLPAIDKPEHDMVAKQLRKFEFTEPQIRELKIHRRFILICDGYDESQQTHNLYTSNQLNQSGEWDAQMVISCRSEYLGVNYQDRFQPGNRNKLSNSALFQEAVLTPFSPDQIQAYIKQYVTVHQPLWQTEDYKQALDLIPSLMDLMKNPFLMALSLDVLPRIVDPGQNASASRVTRVALYDQFIEQWLERGKKRISEKPLSRQARAVFENLNDEGFTLNGIDFIKRFAVAIYMEQGGQPVVEYSRFLDEGSWKDAFFTREDRQMLREACPLKRNGNQHRFIHRSLLEYGLALAVYDPHDKRRRMTTEPLTSRRGSMNSDMSFDISEANEESTSNEQEPDINSPLVWRNFVKDASLLQFLEERVQQEPVFKQQLHSYIEHSKRDKKWRTAAANAITILVRAGVQFIGDDLKGIQIPRADLSYGMFDGAQLQGADLRKVDLRGVWMREANLTGAHMTGVRFGELPFLKAADVIRRCAYSPNGEEMAAAIGDGTIDFYSTKEWKYIGCYPAHTGKVWSIAYSSIRKYLASGGEDNIVRLWNLETNSCDHVLLGHNKDVKCVAYSPRDEHVASASYDKTIRIWDAWTGECLRTLTGHDGEVYCVVYSPDGSKIASSGTDHAIRFWNPDTGDCTNVLRGHSDNIDCVAYSPRGGQVASASDDTTVRLWDVESGKCLRILNGHYDSANRVAYSPNGSQLASGSSDQTVRLWDVETGVCLQVLTGHTNTVLTVAYSPKGDRLVSGGWDKTLRLWDIMNNKPSRFISAGHRGDAFAATFSPSGHQITSGSTDTTVRLWDAKLGACSRVLRGHTSSVFDIDYSPQGNWIVSGSNDKTVRLWEVESGVCRLVLSGHTDVVQGAAISPRGDVVASASWDATVRIWDALTGECQMILIGHPNQVIGVTFSPNGKLIATYGMNNTIRLWDVGTGTCSHTLEGHSSWIRRISFSSKGDLLASASDDMTVRQWDVKTGSCSVVMIHTNGVICVAYSPNDRLLASGTWDGTMRIWDVASSHCRAAIRNIQGAVNYVDWHADADAFNLVTACNDGSLSMWSVVEDGDTCRVSLQWASMTGALTLTGACIQDVRGLSQLNKELMKQRGADGEPINHLQEATKKVIGIASVLSKLKQPVQGTEEASSLVPSAPDEATGSRVEPSERDNNQEMLVQQKQEQPILLDH